MIQVFRRSFLLSLVLLASLAGVNAQSTTVNPATVDVNSLSDAEIDKIVAKMATTGMSTEEAVALARTRGASQVQIDQILQRINDTKVQKQAGGGELGAISQEDALSKKEKIEPTEKARNIFGFHFFNSENLSFSPNVNVPVSESYTLGIGDEVHIAVYGASQKNYGLFVRKNGSVMIPDLGPVYVYGLSFKEASKKIKSRLISIYSGMKGNNPNTFADISLGALQGIKVNVIGEVNLPGTYSLPATASAFNALYLAGGPNENGSFRVIDLIRDGKIITSVDVYAYLVDGKTQKNVQLRDQDVILVRPYVNRIKVVGEFKRTGLFETKTEETVADLLRYTGGFTNKAYTHRLALYRNNSRSLSFKDVEANQYTKIKLINGDEIHAGAITERFDNRIRIVGAIYRPGDYQLKEGMKISDLIEKAEGLKPEAFMERAILTRKKEDLSLEAISFSLKDVLNGKENIDLQREDQIQISSVFELREARTVEIIGEVQFPGTYAWAENMKIADLVFQAGGFKESAGVNSVEISRQLNYEETKTTTNSLLHTFEYNLDRNLKLDAEGETFLLKAFDKVYVRRAPGYRNSQIVSIGGEVKYAGQYAISKKDEKISDLIERAGGLTSEAYVKGASLIRRLRLSEAEYQAKLGISRQDTTENINVEEFYDKTVGVDLQKIMKNKGGLHDLRLQDGDRLLIPSELGTVKVSGSVLNPVLHAFSENTSAKNYINQSGGFSQYAKKNKAYVLYANGVAKTKRGFLFKRFPKIEPGCEIIVPKKPVLSEAERTERTSKWLAITSTLAGLITTISVVSR